MLLYLMPFAGLEKCCLGIYGLVRLKSSSFVHWSIDHLGAKPIYCQTDDDDVDDVEFLESTPIIWIPENEGV